MIGPNKYPNISFKKSLIQVQMLKALKLLLSTQGLYLEQEFSVRFVVIGSIMLYSLVCVT